MKLKRKDSSLRESYLQKEEIIQKERKFLSRFKTKKILVSFLGTGALALGALAFIYFADPQAKSAAFGWLQTDWSGGATSNTAIHETDQTGWTEFADKDDNVDISTSGEITLSNSEGGSFSRGNTENEDFDSSTREIFGGFETEEGVLTFKKEKGASCQNDSECVKNGTCVDGVCQLPDDLLISFRTTVATSTDTFDIAIFNNEVDCNTVSYDGGGWQRVSTPNEYWSMVCDNEDLEFDPSVLPKKYIYKESLWYSRNIYTNCVAESTQNMDNGNREYACYREA